MWGLNSWGTVPWGAMFTPGQEPEESITVVTGASEMQMTSESPLEAVLNYNRKRVRFGAVIQPWFVGN